MSVFHNLYTRKYEATEQLRESASQWSTFNVFDNYLTFVLNSFKLTNIPENPDYYIPPFRVELFFQSCGRAGMFERDGKLFIAPAYPLGSLMADGEFSDYEFVFADGKTDRRKREDCVIGFNNSLKIPYWYKIGQYAEKTSNAYMAVDVSLRKSMLPTIVSASEDRQLKELLDVRNDLTLNKFKEFVVTRDGELSEDDLKILNLYDSNVDDVLAKWDISVRYRNLFYSDFGASNVEIQKRERLTESESKGNTEMVRYTLFNDMYERRIEWVDLCNKKFGCDMKYEINRDISTVAEVNMTMDEKIDAYELELSKGSNIPNESNEPKPEEKEEQDNENPV